MLVRVERAGRTRMSRYLIRRIEDNPAIALRTAHRDRRRSRATTTSSACAGATSRPGDVETRDIRHVFVMTGATPSTEWLDGCVALDAKGFIKTGPDLSPEDLAAAQWPLARPPHLLETSLPGVFAVGDVRGGNIKRVASAVGEGSIAVAFVHQVLQRVGDASMTRTRPARTSRAITDRQAPPKRRECEECVKMRRAAGCTCAPARNAARRCAATTRRTATPASTRRQRAPGDRLGGAGRALALLLSRRRVRKVLGVRARTRIARGGLAQHAADTARGGYSERRKRPSAARSPSPRRSKPWRANPASPP